MLHAIFPPRSRTVREMPPGRRAYAIGDIHGRLDLLTDLLGRIEEDSRARGPERPLIVFLGDIVDRGPGSAGVMNLLMAGLPWADLVCLMGNHEAAMLDAFAGDASAARMWLRQGGIETLASFGVAADVLETGDAAAIILAGRAAVGEVRRQWLEALPLSHWVGDYYFVHAGVRPGVPLDEQAPQDQLWIRTPFLGSRREHGALIVHGHTVGGAIDDRDNRLGLDTGAYKSGRLSAVGLEHRERWFLESAPLAA
ncbi:metallophosphoesterase family protein [Sphingomonas sp.]|uniref:metallophosphoesterase family protein n=1 Tax=Sphingomonas sp. TaxID=28214 RepID=UPI003B006933